jgi:RND family efflux transporter MFP subunit
MNFPHLINRLFSFLTTAIFVASVISCSDSQPQDSKKFVIPDLQILEVQPETIAREIYYDALVQAVNQATVSAQTSGRVVETPVDVGDLVKKGDLILRLTNTEQQAQMNSAKAQFHEADANYQRAQELLGKKLIAKADADKTEAIYQSAKARMQEAEQQLAYTEIRAPYAGIVLNRAVNKGEAVAPGKALMTGLSLENLRLQLDIPQQHIAPLRQFKLARIELPNGKFLETREFRIPPAADPQTQSFKILIDLPLGDYAIYPGTYIKTAFVIGEDQRLVIPSSALLVRGDVTGVYRVTQDRIEFRQVNVASKQLSGYPVLSGLQAGEAIAVDAIAAARAYQVLLQQD